MKATHTRMVWLEPFRMEIQGDEWRAPAWQNGSKWGRVDRMVRVELGSRSPLSAPLGALVRLDVPITGRFVEVGG